MGIGNIADILRTHARERPESTALVLDDRSVSWAELYERAGRVAAGLAAAGVGSQERVALLDKNGVEHFEVFFGAALANAVCVDINWRLAPPEIEFIVNDAEAKLLVVGRDFVPVLDAIADALTTVSTILVIGGHEKYQDYDEWVAEHQPVDPRHAEHESRRGLPAVFERYHRSPQGRDADQRQLLRPVAGRTEMWELEASSVNLVAMPLFHIGGGGWAVAGMYQGATSVLMRDLDPAALTRLIPKCGITHAFVVPAVLQFMLMVPGAADADYSTLKVILYGASPISEDVLARSIELLGCKFWQAYGLTETTGAIVHLPPEDHDPTGPNRHRLRSCGKAGPSVELRIVDTVERQDMPAGTVGEIWVRSPQVMKGYWNNDAATREAIDDDGWFRTGDAGFLDNDGYLFIHDRVKDMIVSGGENVYPAEVENVLMGHPAIADVAVIGVPHDKWGETAKAVVVTAKGADPTVEEIIDFARARLARFKCPTSVDFVDALPRNPSGKVLKKDLRAPYWAGRERQVN